jgi:UDP-N-acetylmuramyl tripeptide synthase
MKTQEQAKSAKTKTGRLKAKLLGTYYGHPIKDMKLICITGTTGKTEVANFVHEILKAAGQPVSIMASDSEIKVGALHKFLSTAWKAGSNYVVVTAPAKSLEKEVFYDLPVHIAALTNFVPASLSDPTANEYASAETALFNMNPAYVVLNRDDSHYQDFTEFAGREGTLTYGSDRFSNIQIIRSKLYKMGCEAELAIGNTNFTVASFLTGEPVVSYMAAAAAIADALHITPAKIEEGIANYDPDNLTKPEID